LTARNSVQDTTLASIRPHSEALGRDHVGARAAAYCAVVAGLLLLFVAIRGASWTAIPSLPLAFELTAAVVAFIVGVLALVRF